MNLEMQAAGNVYDGTQERMRETTCCIVGGNTFNNEILSDFFEAQTGFECHSLAPHGLKKFQREHNGKKYLIFLDCATISGQDAFEKALSAEGLKDEANTILCINVAPEARLEKAALEHGIRGVVYDHLPIEMYHRAARAVLKGELWYSRDVLEKHFLKDDAGEYVPADVGTTLTRREKEILKLLAMGMRNQEIACKLFISPHTVKTHAYNLYKKIQVSNRFEAVQWLEKYRVQ